MGGASRQAGTRRAAMDVARARAFGGASDYGTGKSSGKAKIKGRGRQGGMTFRTKLSKKTKMATLLLLW
jgi:hypothetical protein